jgi:hypothetical protein
MTQWKGTGSGQQLQMESIWNSTMKIAKLQVEPNWVLSIVTDDGRLGRFDVSPYLQYEAFQALRDQNEFVKVVNGGYFVEWNCGADLSGGTIEARWEIVRNEAQQKTA